MFMRPRKKVKISEKRCEPFPVGLMFKLYINLAKKQKETICCARYPKQKKGLKNMDHA